MLYAESIVSGILSYLPTLGEAVLVLIVGYFLAVVGSRLIGRILEMKKLNDTLWANVDDGDSNDDPKTRTVRLAFQILFFCALISFFGALGMGWVASLLIGYAVVMIAICIVAAFSGRMRNFLVE